jgi:hypothetical protein
VFNKQIIILSKNLTMKTAFCAALLAASALGLNYVILPTSEVGDLRRDDAESKLITRNTELSSISSSGGQGNLSLLLSGINQLYGQQVSGRIGLKEFANIAVSNLPFRSIPQDLNYAFYRGINASNVFFQQPDKPLGTGLFLEPLTPTSCNIASTTTVGNGVTLNTSNGNNVASTDRQFLGYWGFKEHVNFQGAFYIYSRSTARANCQH